MGKQRLIPLSLFVSLLVPALSAFAGPPEAQSDRPPGSPAGQWRIAGQNLGNTWSQPAEHKISPANVQDLSPKWVFTTGGDVSATPTVFGDAAYFPDWGALSSRLKSKVASSSGLTRSPI
jgi:polyvinyl alcohol dehydrogenase (cytochrome)